jgi:hypothetical protein
MGFLWDIFILLLISYAVFYHGWSGATYLWIFLVGVDFWKNEEEDKK